MLWNGNQRTLVTLVIFILRRWQKGHYKTHLSFKTPSSDSVTQSCMSKQSDVLVHPNGHGGCCGCRLQAAVLGFTARSVALCWPVPVQLYPRYNCQKVHDSSTLPGREPVRVAVKLEASCSRVRLNRGLNAVGVPLRGSVPSKVCAPTYQQDASFDAWFSGSLKQKKGI